MFKKTLVICLITFSNLVSSQTIATDRPDQTESSSIIPLKSLQIEFGVQFLKNDFQNRNLLPTSLIRYGLSSVVELRFVNSFENNSTINTSQKTRGFSDIEIGAKIQLLKKEHLKTTIAFLSHLVIPTAKKGLSNEKTGSVNKLAVSHDLNEKISFGYNVGYNYFGDNNNGDNNNGDFTYSLATGTNITEKITVYVEVYGEVVNFDNPLSSFDFGLTYLQKDNLQFDISYGTGLNHTMHYYAFGVSWNIAKL